MLAALVLAVPGLAAPIPVALGLEPAGAARNAPSGSVAFTVIDEADPREVSEETVLRVNGAVVGIFRLDAGHRQGRGLARVPAAARYDYTLCGTIVLRDAHGAVERHAVDDGGVLEAPDGRTYEMLAAGEFTRFYLREDRAYAPPLGNRVQGCPRDVA